MSIRLLFICHSGDILLKSAQCGPRVSFSMPNKMLFQKEMKNAFCTVLLLRSRVVADMMYIQTVSSNLLISRAKNSNYHVIVLY